jgi:hypothetical protein
MLPPAGFGHCILLKYALAIAQLAFPSCYPFGFLPFLLVITTAFLLFTT